jgi:phosphatidate cytidylyltransferase
MTDQPTSLIEEQVETSPKVPSHHSGLRARVISALILAPLALVFVIAGGFPFGLLLSLIAIIASDEWIRMTAGQALTKMMRVGILLCVGLVIAFALLLQQPHHSLFLMAAAFILIKAILWSYDVKIEQTHLMFGLFYLVYAVASISWIRLQVQDGLFYFMLLLLVVWASDIFAYIFGRLIGGPKLAPKISPKKTWAGFVGSSVGAASVAGLFGLPFVLDFFDVTLPTFLNITVLMILGAFLGAIGQAGDLFISMFKRFYNIKDTGSLIPGHGGILDRIDALLLVGLVYATILKLIFLFYA